MKRPFILDPENPESTHVLGRLVDYLQNELLNSQRKMLVVVSDPLKSREQEEKYHAIIGEIAESELLYGKKLSSESWKRLLIDAFKHATLGDPDLIGEWEKFGGMELLPALNHPGFVAVGEQSRKFSKKLASAFIEWLLAFQAGAERDR